MSQVKFVKPSEAAGKTHLKSKNVLIIKQQANQTNY